jgi:DtxR family Mn-dependent transcriptional regulator
VTTCALAEQLEVAPASVTNMLKKMSKEGLVHYHSYHGVTLSETGQKIARQIVRRHCLVELYLARILGLPEDQAHTQAEQWEHVLSEILTERIDVVLGHPASDLHGVPIPNQEGKNNI